jgi:hypothetical protein
MMAMEFKLIMGIASIAIGIRACGVYLWQASKAGGIQPHPLSWLLWGIVTVVAFVVQAATGGEAGSRVSALTAAACVLIGLLSLFRHRWRFSLSDWLSLGTGLLLLGYYLSARNLISSAILATAVDIVGYGPTVKKGWFKPYNDSVSSFALNSVKFFPEICALKSYSLTTWLYPATLVLVNEAVAIMLLLRRGTLAPVRQGSDAVGERFNHKGEQVCSSGPVWQRSIAQP